MRLTRLYLARHGRTALNAAGLLRGRLDPELDPVGQAQAAALGEAIGHRDLRLVVASPLRRATATAGPVARAAGLDVAIDPRLVDRDYGPWAGQAQDEVTARWGSLDAAPDVEPTSEVLARALAALADAARGADGGAAVVVSHDAVNRVLLAALDPGLGEAAAVPQDTGCFNVLEWRAGDWSVLSVNDHPAA